MNKQKKLQRDFFTKITFLKKFWARAHFRARRALNLISLWKPKNHGFFAQVVEYSTGARAEVRARQKFFYNQKVHKISYLLHILDVFISSKLMVLKRIELLLIWAKKNTTAIKK